MHGIQSHNESVGKFQVLHTFANFLSPHLKPQYSKLTFMHSLPYPKAYVF
jgi:hypothetical protein